MLRSLTLKREIWAIVFFCFAVRGYSQYTMTTFEERKAAFLARNGVGNEHCGQAVWAYLENNDQSKADLIHNHIVEWSTATSWGDWGEYCTPWRTGADWSCVFLARIYYQYGDRISQEDKEMLEDLFYDTAKDKYFYRAGDPWTSTQINNQALDYSFLYVYAQDKKDLMVPFGDSSMDWVHTVSYDGREYHAGDIVNAYNFARDWIYSYMDKIVEIGDIEMDSSYTRAYIVALLLLYDFAVDTEMKRKAKMLLDFYFIESILDVSGAMYCGWFGRTYGHLVISGHPQVYWRIYWGIGDYDPGSIMGNYYDAYVSTYRMQELIEDIGILEDEPDDYWHINKENNRANYMPLTTGKWSFITKNYNLGGCPSGWTFNMRSGEDDMHGIRIWINEEENIGEVGWGDTVGEENYIKIGKNGFQYKNAMLIKCSPPYIHIEMNENDGFDLDQSVSGWRFLVEGKAAVAIKMNSTSQALEAATLGVDYDTYYDFKDAILNEAELGSGYYRTTQGTKIWYQYDSTQKIYYTYAGSQNVWDYPFKRIETATNTGEKIVYWNGKTMYVQHHGKRLVYDFDNWTWSESSDTDAPNAPQGVTVQSADN